MAIETSCDETSLAVLELSRGKLTLRASTIASQTELHARWGGVVPELAARQHAEQIIPLLDQTLEAAKVRPRNLNLIAVTQGPGLITALQVGVETARSLAYAWGKPLIGVNHIAGHLVSPFLATGSWPLATSKKTWPAVALVVSGGHTELYLMKSLHQWKLLGKTLDDAAGEAFDKVAKMLGLPYPGGPAVAKLAKNGSRTAYNFPRPMLNRQNYNFSFAGLKTAVLYTIQKSKIKNQKYKSDICASFQQAAIDVLVEKTLRAAQEYGAHSVLVVGGVAANQALRHQLTIAAKRLHPIHPAQRGPSTLYPDLKFTGDNAAMIALAGALQAKTQGLSQYRMGWKTVNANANWELWD